MCCAEIVRHRNKKEQSYFYSFSEKSEISNRCILNNNILSLWCGRKKRKFLNINGCWEKLGREGLISTTLGTLLFVMEEEELLRRPAPSLLPLQTELSRPAPNLFLCRLNYPIQLPAYSLYRLSYPVQLPAYSLYRLSYPFQLLAYSCTD